MPRIVRSTCGPWRRLRRSVPLFADLRAVLGLSQHSSSAGEHGDEGIDVVEVDAPVRIDVGVEEVAVGVLSVVAIRIGDGEDEGVDVVEADLSVAVDVTGGRAQSGGPVSGGIAAGPGECAAGNDSAVVESQGVDCGTL